MNAVCDYCGLPAPGAADSACPAYCCLGCRIAADLVSTSGDESVTFGRTAFRLILALFFSMNVMLCSMVLWSWDAYAISTSVHAETLRELLRILALLFATPVVVVLGRPLIQAVAEQWSVRRVTTDSLLVAGVLAAFAYSVVSILTDGEHIYLEVACMILLAVTLGRWLEAEGKQKAMKSLRSLQDLLPATARVVDDSGASVATNLEDVQIGDVIRVLPGERLPLDGVIARGTAFVDERLVTGESEPVQKSTGGQVFGGTLNQDGSLDVTVTSGPKDGVIPRLVAAVEAAAGQRSRAERQADRLTRLFVPLVMLLVATVFGIHYWTDGFRAALLASMSVALIACPCALAIATPLAVWAALGTAARYGVVFRTSDDLLALAEIDTICFDKTGTLTEDRRDLSAASYADEERTVLRVALQMANRTTHPIAKALRDAFPSEVDSSDIELDAFQTIPGNGVSARITSNNSGLGDAGSQVVLGSERFCATSGMKTPISLKADSDLARRAAQSLLFVGWGGLVRGCFVFDETLRDDAAASVQRLRELQIEVTLLSGDQIARTSRVADALQIHGDGGQLPASKQDAIRRLQADGHQVAMVGDGLNDAPALSLADVGIAMGSGVEIARDAADVCLISSQLSTLPWAVELAKRTQRTIRRNLIWAVGYNTVGIALAATGRLNPIVAALAMVMSSAFVIAESLRLRSSSSSEPPAVEKQVDDLGYTQPVIAHAASGTIV